MEGRARTSVTEGKRAIPDCIRHVYVHAYIESREDHTHTYVALGDAS